MALVERLMGLNDDGTPPTETPTLKISVHDFFAGCHEVIVGSITVAQVKTALGIRNTVDASGTSDEADFDAFVALAPDSNNLSGRSMFVDRAHSVFILAEKGYAGYDTPAAVRIKIAEAIPIDKNIVKLTADLAATSSTALIDATGLTFSVVSGNYYYFTFNVIFQSNGTTNGLRLSVNVPAFTRFSAKAYIPNAADGTGGEFQGWITASDDTVVGTAVQAANTDYYATLEGIILPSANGNVQLRYGSELGPTSAIIIRQASFGKLERIF